MTPPISLRQHVVQYPCLQDILIVLRRDLEFLRPWPIDLVQQVDDAISSWDWYFYEDKNWISSNGHDNDLRSILEAQVLAYLFDVHGWSATTFENGHFPKIPELL